MRQRIHWKVLGIALFPVVSQILMRGAFGVCSLFIMTQAEERETMISFKGAHFPQEIILMGVRWSLAYPLS